MFLRIFVPLRGSLYSSGRVNCLGVERREQWASCDLLLENGEWRLEYDFAFGNGILGVLGDYILIYSYATLDLTFARSTIFAQARYAKAIMDLLDHELSALAPDSGLLGNWTLLAFLLDGAKLASAR